MNTTLPSRRHWLLAGTSLAAAAAVAVIVMNDEGHRAALWSPFETPAAPSAGSRSQTLDEPERTGAPKAQRTVQPVPLDQVQMEEERVAPPESSQPFVLRGVGIARDADGLADRAEGAATSAPAAMAKQRALTAESAASAPPPPALARDAAGGFTVTMPAPGIVFEPMPPQGYVDEGRDRFETFADNPLKVTAEEPVSTFSIDVDTASYAFMRREIMRGVLPQPDAVRIEELINYFPYDYAPPADAETPFAAHLDIMPTPWNSETRLLRIGIKGYDIAPAERPAANLVFLIDSSGSMDAPDKLPLLLNSFRLLLDRLGPQDKVAIVAYAGSAGTVLEPTPASEKGTILAALERLHAGGSTAGAEGIRQAYRLAESAFVEGGVNRVILATDGDFNVGITEPDELEGFVEREREAGVFLSVLGFGQGNYNDALMQTLAQNGNGQAAYIDTLSEARKVLVEEATSALFPIAKDVKIQIEFNPATVSEYRLIGYETRALRREDFNNDKVDAGEIGSGHAVTALYELTPAGSERAVEPLRYGTPETAAAPDDASDDEYGFLKIRYKMPEESASRLIEMPITKALDGTPDRETRFAAAVAAFGQLLRGGTWLGGFGYDEVIALAQQAKGPDPYGYRAEFVNLVRLARSAAALPPLRR